MMTMTTEHAVSLLKELGDSYAVSMIERTGKSIEDHTPVMNGLAAYYMLDLRGESDWLDEAVDIVVRIAYDLAVEMMHKQQKGR